jgi:hypothetical protein
MPRCESLQAYSTLACVWDRDVGVGAQESSTTLQPAEIRRQPEDDATPLRIPVHVKKQAPELGERWGH